MRCSDLAAPSECMPIALTTRTEQVRCDICGALVPSDIGACRGLAPTPDVPERERGWVYTGYACGQAHEVEVDNRSRSSPTSDVILGQLRTAENHSPFAVLAEHDDRSVVGPSQPSCRLAEELLARHFGGDVAFVSPSPGAPGRGMGCGSSGESRSDRSGLGWASASRAGTLVLGEPCAGGAT